MKRSLGWTLGAFAALIAAFLLLLRFPPAGWIADKLEGAIAARTGYAVEIGELRLDLLHSTPSAALSTVTVDGAKLPGLLEADRVEFGVDLRAALGGRFVVDTMLVGGAALTLRRDAEGLASWTPGAVEPAANETDGEATEPERGPSLPTVREMRADDLSVMIDDAVSGTTASFDVAANGSTLPGRTPLVVTIEGVANEVPVNGRLELESPLRDISPGEPVRLALDLATDGAVLDVAGGVDDVVTLDGLDLQLDLDVDSLAALGAALDRKLPPLAPATLVATVRSDGDGTVVAVEGSVDGAPVRADLQLASSIRDLRAGAPLELDLDATAGGSELALAGRVGDPGAFVDVDLELEVVVGSLVALESLLGRELPDLAPATFSGSLRRDDGEYVVPRFDLAAAGSELGGDVRADPTTTPPSVHANLISTRLDVDALLEATEAAGSETEADETAPEAAGPVLAWAPLPVAALFDTVQGAIALRVDELRYAAVPLDAFDARLELASQDLTLSIDGADFADGRLDATLGLAAAHDGALDAKLDLEVARVMVGRLLPDIELVDDAGGPLGGRAELWASGASVAGLAGTLDGGALLLMGRGRLDALLVELAGLDLVQSLGDLVSSGEEEFPLRCAYVSLFADSGVVSVEQFVIDTQDTVFLAEGSIDLGAETIALEIEPHPKDLSLLSASTSFGIGGTFAAPELELGPELTARTVAAAVLAAAATPAAALLAFVETGEGEDSTFCELEGALDGDAG